MKKNLGLILLLILSMSVFFGCNLPQNNNVPDNSDSSGGRVDDQNNEVLDGDVGNDISDEIDQEFGTDLIMIEEPGDLSEITSPVFVSGIAGPTFEQNIVVRITDVAGNILAEEPTTILADIGKAGAYMVQLEFSITEDTPGRVTVFHTSAMNGAMQHAASAPVTLLASGNPTININIDSSEVIEILTPEFNQDVSSGVITVTGNSEYFFEATLVIALCGSGGNGLTHPICGTEDNVLAVSYANIESPDIGIGGPFSGTVEFSVSEEMPATLLVYAVSPMDGGLEHLSSVPIILVP